MAKKTKFLQLLRNLRDESNGQLRLRVALSHLTPSDLVTMSATELAPEEVQKEIEDLQEYKTIFEKLTKLKMDTPRVPQSQVSTIRISRSRFLISRFCFVV